MKKKIVELEYNQMLNLFVSGHYKLPFSSQPGLTLAVCYHEYIEFIRWLSTSNLSLAGLLYHPDKYKELLTSYDKGARKIFESVFIYDVLTACIRELNMSQIRHLQPTCIMGVFHQADYVIGIDEIDGLLPELIDKKAVGIDSFQKSMSLINRQMQVRLIPDEMDEVSRNYYYYCLLLGFTFYSAKDRSIINLRKGD